MRRALQMLIALLPSDPAGNPYAQAEGEKVGKNSGTKMFPLSYSEEIEKCRRVTWIGWYASFHLSSLELSLPLPLLPPLFHRTVSSTPLEALVHLCGPQSVKAAR